MTINIFQVPPDANFNFCGCGNGTTGSGGSGSGGGQLPPGGTAGGNTYNGEARVIDICANIETIFLDAIQDWVDSVQNLGYIPNVANLLPVAPNVILDALQVDQLIDDFLASIGEFEGELYGAKFGTAIKKWIVREFDDPFGGFQSRSELQNLILKMGFRNFVVAGAPLLGGFYLWSATADIDALNKRIKDSAGTASVVGECAQLQREAGREPYQPPASDDSVIVINADSYKYTRVLSDTLSDGADQNYTLSGENFVAVLVRWRTFGGSGEVGTASLFSVAVTHTDGETNAGVSVGSSNAPGTVLRVGGETDFGATAASDVPSYLSDFSGETNAKDPSAATFPVSGSFTGTFNAETRFTYSAELQVWVVTDLDGSAEASQV